MDLNKSKILGIAVCMAGLGAMSAEAQLNISDYCDLNLCTPKGVKDITPLNDGESYAAISEDGKSIETYSFKTGKKTGELFNLSTVKGEVKIPDFDGFEISGNGKKILLWNNKTGIYRYSFRAEYYVYDTFRMTITRVSENGPQRAATITKDGRFVAFERDNNIFISNLDFETETAITKDGEAGKILNGAPDWTYEEEFGVLNTMKWNSEGNVLCYVRFDESEVPPYNFDLYQGICDDKNLSDAYPSTYSYKYPLAGYPNSVVSVHSYNLDNKVTKKMDLPITATDYVPSIEFDGEGNRLMVMILNHEQNNLRIYNVNPGSTIGTLVYTDKSDTWISPLSYQMVDYGVSDFAIGSEKSGQRHMYLYDYNGALKKQITKGDFNVTAYYGRDSRGNHFMQTTSLGPINRSVVCVDAKGVLRLLTKEEGTTAANFSKNFDYCLLSYSSAVQAPQYRLYSSAGTKLADVELNEAYMKKYASAPKMEFLQVKNDAGEMMNAYMIKPQNFDSNKKYPLLMYQYNGPDSQEVLNKWRMEGIFYLASQGYIVACVDGRGTGNRDNAWSKCVYKKLGDLETKDQLAGAKYFSSLPYVDPQRTACFGWSYGGYMTLMELGNPASTFKAGVAMAAVSDWRFYDSVYTERFMLTPQQNAMGYENASALKYSGNVRGRLLILSGTNDDNVHMYNSLKYVSKLSSEGKVCDMMVYPGYEHSLRMCDARVQLFRKIADFLHLNL